MAKSNKSRFAILGMLASAPKSSGYDIKKFMEESTQFFWKESYGSIYPVLGALVEEGLITQHENSAKNERQRNVYELSAEGKKELKEWMTKPVEWEQSRNELLLKLFFGEFVPLSTTRKHVEEFQQMLTEKDKMYQAIRETLQTDQKNEPGLPFWLMTLDFGMRHVQASLDWCRNALKQYDHLEKSH